MWSPVVCGSGLRGMLAQRRKLLQYLRRADFDAYACMLSSLGLKDTYAKQARMLLLRWCMSCSSQRLCLRAPCCHM